MRRVVLKHRGRKQDAAGVSLFPFLAVLICTMGALIMLLVVLAHQARLQAAEAVDTAETETAEELDDLTTQREMVQWRIEQLQNSLRKTESQLGDARLALGHVEDHARRLSNRLDRLKEAYDQLNQLAGGSGRQREQVEAELGRAKVEIAKAKQQLDEAQRTAGKRRNSFAVVPYRGPHDTFRRPIYIECGAHTITLQPEGIVLGEQDFEGPMGPGNPLAAALRAAREYLLTHGDIDPQQSGEPYPLLLVRPDGISAYYAARAALKSWGSEFGYELIGDDWKLAFRRSDSEMAAVVRRAVDVARVRQARLAAAAPSRYPRSGQARYRVAPTRGGVIRDGGFAGGGDSGSRRQRPAGGFSGDRGSAQGSRPNRTSSAGGSQHQGVGQHKPGSPGTFADGRPREAVESPGSSQGVAQRPGEWKPKPDSPAKGSPEGPSGQQVESLAKTRGRNWALPDASSGSVPLTRPIRVDCYPDRLLIVPERGLSGAELIPLGPRAEDTMDEFRSAIWQHMDSWGIAGKGMYWRPVLKVHVAAGADWRFQELQALLDDSGLTLERK